MDTRKAVALLIYLAITRQGHRRDALANLFWPEYDQSHARATLRRTLSALNKALDGNWLLADRDTIALDPAIPIWIDTETFLQYVTEYRLSIYATEQPDPNGIDALKQAVALYQGDFLTGFHFSGNTNFDSWQFFQADTLRREYSYALEQLVQYYSRRADFDLAIDYAQRWLSLDRFHEPAHYALIQLYAWTGHRATALQQYEECVRILEREFDIQPMPETEQLYIAIKESQDLPLLMPIRSEQRSTEKTLQTEKGDPITLDTTPIIPTTFDTEAATDDSPLFGRSEVWTQLLSAYGKARFHGHVILLEGETGIGKTRLAEEIIAYAQKQGASIIRVRCFENESNIAYSPIVNGLQAALADAQNFNFLAPASISWLQEVMHLLPEFIASSLGNSIPSSNGRPEIQHHFYKALSQLLHTISSHDQATAPGIIFFDDVHWADVASIRLLTYFMHRYYGTALCVLFTWRTPQPEKIQPLYHSIIELSYEDMAIIPTLSRIDAATVLKWSKKYITFISEQVALDLSQRLYAETEGLPFFLTEYIMALKSGMLHSEDDLWQVPHRARDMLIAQLAVAGNIGKEMLSAASVIGHSFDFDMLREVSGHNEEHIITALEQLIRQGLIQERPAIQLKNENEGMRILMYIFGHDQLRRQAYKETSQARRCLFHRRAAEAMISRGAEQHDISALTEQIAYHYRMANAPSKSAE